ncbi:MAG: hypothetical protein DMG56_02245 [Acidobacteria bacterium]|nr:MAG: hypothetical protein DMG53_25360 [Acidobacteriota bacterium]PYU44472.1 MAG: hypothetical protein DMG54_08955 [Acidobacteriota bacterium]PYU65795.1 MAG: hypothetical protein DMG56_02245 [Acidobacteriota bacterium]PYU69938.1 MAG: hypothetical protein DMG52_27460 [Acidobacteriota bacterium]
MGSDYAGEVSAASRSAKVVEPIAIAVCCLVIIVALVVGVGLAAGLVLRHVVQTLPLWIGVLAGARRSRAVGWIGLPMFLFWLVLMSLIWLYLLGIARVISGHFSPIEIAMTILVGAAAIVGIAMFARVKWSLSGGAGLGLFLLVAVAQWVCFRVSFLPAIANR